MPVDLRESHHSFRCDDSRRKWERESSNIRGGRPPTKNSRVAIIVLTSAVSSGGRVLELFQDVEFSEFYYSTTNVGRASKSE